MRDLCTKWNSVCKSVHKKHPHFLERATNFSAASPTSSASVSSNDHRHGSKLHHPSSMLSWPLIFEPNGHNQSPKECKFFASETEIESLEPKVLTMCKQPDTKPELLSNPNSSPNSASSSEASGGDMDCLLPRFKENNPENDEILCTALEKKVPWQKEIIPDIVSTILECRSGKRNNKSETTRKRGREDAWLLFSGVDFEGKEKIARELSRVVFGSQDNFITVNLSVFSSSSNTRIDHSTEEVMSKKRSRDEHGKSYLERFGDAVHENPGRVFFMEDVNEIDHQSQKGLKKAVETGNFTLPDGETVELKDAIVIISCESSFRAASPPNNMGKRDETINEKKEVQNGETASCGPLDLNIASNEDEDGDWEHAFSDEIRIIDLVDKQVVFKVQVL